MYASLAGWAMREMYACGQCKGCFGAYMSSLNSCGFLTGAPDMAMICEPGPCHDDLRGTIGQCVGGPLDLHFAKPCAGP